MEVYQGTVKTGRAMAAQEMKQSDTINDIENLTGLKVIAGTLNIDLTKPFDISLLKNTPFSLLGWDFDQENQGIEFKKEIGVHYHRIKNEAKIPGILAFWTWVNDLNINGEILSNLHLRTELDLKDGDLISFVLD